MNLLLVVLLTAICGLTAKQYHKTPTYFHRRHDDGTLVDRAEPGEFLSGVECSVELLSEELEKNSSIRIYPAVLENGALANVVWDVNINASYQDFLGIYCGVKSHSIYYPNTIDHFHVAVSPSWKAGHGSHVVNVYNLRVECRFHYYHQQGKSCTLIAKSDPLHFRGGAAAPLQGHIAIGNHPSEMRVMWTSGSTSAPFVRYGTSVEHFYSKVAASAETYRAEHMCSAPASADGFIDPGFMHEAMLTDLQPNTRYFYQFGSAEGMSDVYNFTSSLPAGDAAPFTFLTYGDHGVSKDRLSPGADHTAANIVREYQSNTPPRLIFHHGDLSYAVGYAYLWDQWMQLISPYARALPYMVGMGNHEQDHLGDGKRDPSGAPGPNGWHPKWGNYGGDSGGECGVPSYFRFHMPDNGNRLWWYSFDYGLVHFIMMSTEHNFTRDSRQYRWLENDMSKVDRKKTPWLILAGHRPMYNSQNEGDIGVANHMQALFEDLLHLYRVDLAFWSHVHSYQRMCKLYKKECREDGTVHIVVGSAGRSLDPEWFLDDPFLVQAVDRFGYGRVNVANATHMQYEFVDNEGRETVDSVWLIK